MFANYVLDKLDIGIEEARFIRELTSDDENTKDVFEEIYTNIVWHGGILEGLCL
jgi:hypothetical protein